MTSYRGESPLWKCPSRPRLVAIVGPTSAGKTELALRLASRLQVEVIGADSRQVYRYMDIGTAKPTPDQLSAVPHCLVDIINPDVEFGLGDFLYLSKNAILNANASGKRPLLVGGTGQYVMALLENWNVPPVPPNPVLRQELDMLLVSEGLDALLGRLRELDPDAPGRIDAANPRRVVRAIEVAAAGVSTAAAPRRLEPWFDSTVIGIGMERPALYERADARVDRMMNDGFLDEVRGLLDMGYDPDLPSMSGIGYHELADHLLNGADLNESVQKTKFRTRRFIRRQSNWFRHSDRRINWFEPSDMDLAIEFALRWVESGGVERVGNRCLRERLI